MHQPIAMPGTILGAKLSSDAKILYSVMLHFSTTRDGNCYYYGEPIEGARDAMSLEDLQDAMNVDADYVTGFMEELSAAGAIEITKGGIGIPGRILMKVLQ